MSFKTDVILTEKSCYIHKYRNCTIITAVSIFQAMSASTVFFYIRFEFIFCYPSVSLEWQTLEVVNPFKSRALFAQQSSRKPMHPDLLQIIQSITKLNWLVLESGILRCTFHFGTIHLRRRQIFANFDPYPPRVGNRFHIFINLSLLNFMLTRLKRLSVPKFVRYDMYNKLLPPNWEKWTIL